jgi:hypothetical protein
MEFLEKFEVPYDERFLFDFFNEWPLLLNLYEVYHIL